MYSFQDSECPSLAVLSLLSLQSRSLSCLSMLFCSSFHAHPPSNLDHHDTTRHDMHVCT